MDFRSTRIEFDDLNDQQEAINDAFRHAAYEDFAEATNDANKDRSVPILFAVAKDSAEGFGLCDGSYLEKISSRVGTG